MEEILTNILPIGVLLTFVGTLITIYNTRKNLKTTKYIETITSERLKWIKNLREDISTLLSWITIYSCNKYEISKLEKRSDFLMERGHYDHNIDEFVPNSGDEEELDIIGKEINFFKVELSSISREKIIEKVNLIKLRLNPSDDVEAIELLDRMINEVVMIKFTEKHFQNSEDVKEKFIKIAQGILKSEWEKVKKEAK